MISTQSQNIKKYRPLIKSLSFESKNNQQLCLPFQYSFSISEIEKVKKYLHNSFSFLGVDFFGQPLSQSQKQTLHKHKLKLKGHNGESTGDFQFSVASKEEILMLEWESKVIRLLLPYNDKYTSSKLKLQVFEHVSFYLQNYLFFVNNETHQIFLDPKICLTGDEIGQQVDVHLNHWQIPIMEGQDNKNIQFLIKMPLTLCLERNRKYNMNQIKQLLKADINNSFQILFLHDFDTKICLTGNSNGMQNLCLNSYCKGQKDQEAEYAKLKEILNHNLLSKAQIQKNQHKAQVNRKKENKFLISVLIILILIYVGLKAFPISNPSRSFYSTQHKSTFHDDIIQVTKEQEEILF